MATSETKSTSSADAPTPSSVAIRHPIAQEVVASGLTVAAFLAIETLLVGIVFHRHLTGPWELRVALTRILPVAIACSLPIACVSVAIARLIDDGRRATRITVTILAGLAAVLLGQGVTQGRHFQQFEVRTGFIAIFATVVAAVCWWLIPRIAKARSRSPRLVAAACVALVIVLELMNLLVLPRLYPAFHIALSVLVVASAAWLGRALAPALSARYSLETAAGFTILTVAACPWAVADLPKWDNVRFLYVARAPTLTHALRIASWAHPPDRPRGTDSPPGQAVDQTRWLNWQDRDVLIITVDAVRADHVGAYGYDRPTTPSIDALAARGVVFDRAYTVMPHTSFAMTSLMTGKYMRPLLMQRTGQDSDTLAGLMRTYGYRTAAFYPPSLFAVDEELFEWAKSNYLGFEYRKIEYASASVRLRQALDYLAHSRADQRLFVWTHFFEPHEPYDPPPGHGFGDRDVDRYDGEIAAADRAVGKLVDAMLQARPDTVVILTADHGEAFGDHGTYYHGTTVYEEQVRVPLIVVAKGLSPRRVAAPVQLIDLLPTMLRSMDIPRRPRVRGWDLSGWLTGHGEGEGFAFSESHDQMLLAEGTWRLICERKIDACSLFDLGADPQQTRDVSAQQPERYSRMRTSLRNLEASHGTYERAGSRAEGKDLPAPLVRGMAGDADAAMDVAALLDDADVVLRRKAGEVLFRLQKKETAPALTLAVSRDEDVDVRRWCALSLTRLGHGAPLTKELLELGDVKWSRLAALALAESGDGAGEAILLSWWSKQEVPIETRKEIAKAFAVIRSRDAVVPLTRHLHQEQLRPVLATALAEIGDPYAKIPLLRQFSSERYSHTRIALARALVTLGATRELAPSVRRFLGVPDPMRNGVKIALEGKFLDALGGPEADVIKKLQHVGIGGTDFQIVVPKGGNGTGYRVLVLAQANGRETGKVQFGVPVSLRDPVTQLDPKRSVTLDVAPGEQREVFGRLPEGIGAKGGRPLQVVMVPGRDVSVSAFAVVPLDDEIPPPPPEPWEETQDP